MKTLLAILEQFLAVSEYGAEEGTIEHDEKEMIERIFAFNNLRARDVMIPKQRVFTLDSEQTIGEVLPKIMTAAYSRIPLYSGKPDSITGVLFMRDVFSEALRGRTRKRLKKVSHEHPLFVPVNQPVEQLFPTLRHDERRLVQGRVDVALGEAGIDHHGRSFGEVGQHRARQDGDDTAVCGGDRFPGAIDPHGFDSVDDDGSRADG